MNKKKLKEFMSKFEELEKSYDNLNNDFNELINFVRLAGNMPRFVVENVTEQHYWMPNEHYIKVTILERNGLIIKTINTCDFHTFRINGDYIEIVCAITGDIEDVYLVGSNKITPVSKDLYLKAFPDRQKEQESDGEEPEVSEEGEKGHE